ncbi:MAG: hypothetical protein LBB41_07440 [Prevotellaceae bacterium]|jgi:hypothetical protein|nr:hypothetical protein [Prevotellaceae bacterium]
MNKLVLSAILGFVTSISAFSQWNVGAHWGYMQGAGIGYKLDNVISFEAKLLVETSEYHGWGVSPVAYFNFFEKENYDVYAGLSVTYFMASRDFEIGKTKGDCQMIGLPVGARFRAIKAVPNLSFHIEIIPTCSNWYGITFQPNFGVRCFF